MDTRLAAETEKLVRSWSRHDAAMLRDYLVRGVEDPRVNLQSILTRHFLARGVLPEPPARLTEQEVFFSAAANALLQMKDALPTREDAELLLHALRSGADNFEGTPVPGLLRRVFPTLPTAVESGPVPNYLEDFLRPFDPASAWNFTADDARLNLFPGLWRTLLQRAFPDPTPPLETVLEAACGSANDYRWLRACGWFRNLDYTGFDLCAANIENARALFPDARFQTGNVFALPASDRQYDLCFTHDLFEHLSAAGIEAAAAELCRVTRRGLSVGFFNMSDETEHLIEPYEEYHWNRLSAERMRETFARHGFAARVIHIGTFFRAQTGFDVAHNPNAWTFWLERAWD